TAPSVVAWSRGDELTSQRPCIERNQQDLSCRSVRLFSARTKVKPMNKLQTLASYENRLSRVVDHIYAHLDEDIRFDDLAEVACLSPYHWHRIYAAMRGETITATIR